MSDQGEKTCPLCAEEMDLTDQQLRPCKCGYEICVWCWHHIMDMAEKDNTEGRCPACRTPYNKEKIVGTASKCERLVTGMSVEKKQKPQKGKSKTCEGRKQLGSVRVIQRNLVYIVGLPLNLADEDLLQQKEYFGRYGKVLKVSISRTAAGAIQQFANSTCSVYITYSKEEEAVRSIQAAHGFVLEGRTLRACFGTTKYCHAWLRNAPCTNADCLYLHEFGPEEDSFTKDEIVSANTRNRVQQITGVTNEMQRRSGNLLPPPADDYSSNNNNTCAWPKPFISKTTSNNPANGMKVPANGIKVPQQPNSGSGKSTALPAAASWGTRASNSTALPFTSAVVSPSFPGGDELVVQDKGSLGNSASVKEDVGGTDNTTSDKYSTDEEDEEVIINNSSFDMSSSSINSNQRLQQPSSCEADQFVESLTSNEAENTDLLVSDLQKKVAQVAITEAEQDLLSFNDQRLEDTQVIHNLPHNNNTGYYPLHAHAPANGGLHPPSSQYSSNVTGTCSKENGTQGHKSQNGALDLGENNIISNILSMDFDPWDESLTSPQNLAKFLGGGSDKQQQQQSESHNRVLSSRKAQNSNQSRFSFARQDDECTDEGSGYGDFGDEYNNSIYVDNNKHNGGNGFSSFRYGEPENIATNYFPMSENKIPVSRAQVSAPPGFSGPIRAPPPGFTSQERIEQTFDTVSDVFGGPYGQGSYFSGNHNNMNRKAGAGEESVNMGDIEFMDPAILAVGGSVNNTPRGGLDMMRGSNLLPSSSSSSSSCFENDVRLQLLMQRSFSQQNPNPSRFTELGFNNYYPLQQTDSYGIPSRIIMDHHTLSSHSHSHQQQSRVSNSYWNGWNEVENGNERLGFSSRYYLGHDDAKFQLPARGDLYNRTFGI